MEWAHIAAAILSAFRLTTLFTQDSVWEPVRKRLPQVPWACSLCMSVWSGALALALLLALPWLNWPLAFSWLYLANEALRMPKQKPQAPAVADAEIRIQTLLNEDDATITGLLNRNRQLAVANALAQKEIAELKAKANG